MSSCSHQRDANEVRRLERKLSMAATVDKDPQSYDIMTLEQFQIEMDKVNVNTYHAKVRLKDFAVDSMTLKQLYFETANVMFLLRR